MRTPRGEPAWNLWERRGLDQFKEALVRHRKAPEENGFNRVVQTPENVPSAIMFRQHALEVCCEEEFFVRGRPAESLPSDTDRDKRRVSAYSERGLPFEKDYGWIWEDPLHRLLFHEFFSGTGPNAAWVALIGYRVPSVLRSHRFEDHSREQLRLPLSRAMFIDLDLANCRHIPLQGSFLLPLYPSRRRRHQLIKRVRRRFLSDPSAGNSLPESIDCQWFVGDAEVENNISELDFKRLDCVSPMAYHLFSNDAVDIHLFTTVTLVMAKIDVDSRVDPFTGPSVLQLLITISTANAHTVVIAEGRRTLFTYCLQYSEEHSLLRQAIAQILGNTNETIGHA